MNRIATWWFAPAPAERLAALRILIGGYALVYVVARLPEFVGVSRFGASQWRPHGIVRILDAPLLPAVVGTLAVATCVLMALFVAGIAYRIVAPIAALALLWTITYRNCWGMPFHTENLLVLHVIALAVVPAANAWAFGARARPEPEAGFGWPIKLLVTLSVATYLLAGIAKLRIAGTWMDGIGIPRIGWIDGELLRNQIAIDNLRKALLGDGIAPFAHLVLDHPTPLVVFSVLTMLLELGAPLALLHARIGYVWAIGAWGFHVGVVLLMNIWFPYALAGMAFLPLVPAERVIHAATGIARRLRR
jgi:hypothetical protein